MDLQAKRTKGKKYKVKGIISTIKNQAISASVALTTFNNPLLTEEDRLNIHNMLQATVDYNASMVNLNAKLATTKDPEEKRNLLKQIGNAKVRDAYQKSLAEALNIDKGMVADMRAKALELQNRPDIKAKQENETDQAVNVMKNLQRAENDIQENKKGVMGELKSIGSELGGDLLTLIAAPIKIAVTITTSVVKIVIALAGGGKQRQEKNENEQKCKQILIPYMEKVKKLEADLEAEVDKFIDLYVESEISGNPDAFNAELSAFIAEKMKEYGLEASTQIKPSAKQSKKLEEATNNNVTTGNQIFKKPVNDSESVRGMA